MTCVLGVVVLLHDPHFHETLFLNNVLTFSFRICWYNSEFIVPSMMAGCPGQDAAKQAQAIILPPPCFTDGIRFLSWKQCAFFSPNIIDSHLNQQVLFWFHPSIKPFSNSPMENSGFLLATLSCTPWLLSVLLMVGSWTLTLVNVRKAFSCLEVTLGTFDHFSGR